MQNNNNNNMEPSAPPYSFSSNPFPQKQPHPQIMAGLPMSGMSGGAPPPQHPPPPPHHPHLGQHQHPPQGIIIPAALQPQPQNGTMNVPPMMYVAPGAVQQQIPNSMPAVPIAALKPMPHPPPFPSLTEVDLNEDRQQVKCPYCYASITTRTSFRSGTMTHIAAVAVLVVCCPFFWVPYCVECCKDVDHGCPNCGRSIGRFRRFN